MSGMGATSKERHEIWAPLKYLREGIWELKFSTFYKLNFFLKGIQ